MNYRIAVLGPIPRDHIITHHGEVIQKYGCITHPVAALSKLCSGQSTIFPVSHIRKIDEAPIRALLNSFDGVDQSYVRSEHDQGAVIRLQFIDQNKRIERQLAFMAPILPEDVANLTDCDAFVFVPITDHEVSLDTLRYLKENSDGLIIFDAHGPTATMARNGTRHLKFWVDRDQWLPYIDILKMNLEESACCWYKNEYSKEELTEELHPDTSHLPELAAHCLAQGLKALIVTTDETGCLTYFMKDGKMQEEFVPSIRVNHVVDTTGCGDSFAGGLAFGWLKNEDYISAAQFANAVGAQRTQGKTFEVFQHLEETERMIRDGFL
ncbi:MAG: carbohydrate kinase family protein [Saprospiraceae bacterium]|nr:carbohydrate kinase family protein [Saprospiraceae bacterium]